MEAGDIKGLMLLLRIKSLKVHKTVNVKIKHFANSV